MDQRISVITLGVADLSRARRFYEEGLGWRRGNRDESVAFYQLPGMVLALWARDLLAEDAGLAVADTTFAGMALAHNVRSREEVDGVLAEAEAAGGRITRAAAETVWGGYSGYFADPDGHVWEVAWNPFWPLDAAGGVHLG